MFKSLGQDGDFHHDKAKSTGGIFLFSLSTFPAINDAASTASGHFVDGGLSDKQRGFMTVDLIMMASPFNTSTKHIAAMKYERYRPIWR